MGDRKGSNEDCGGTIVNIGSFHSQNKTIKTSGQSKLLLAFDFVLYSCRVSS